MFHKIGLDVAPRPFKGRGQGQQPGYGAGGQHASTSSRKRSRIATTFVDGYTGGVKLGVNRFGAMVAILGLFALSLAFHVFGDKTATLQWDYDYTKDPPCSGDRKTASPRKGCVVGFNAFVGTPANRSNQKFVPNQFDPSGKIVSKGISVTLQLQHYGNTQFCVTSVAQDQTGGTVESLPICSTRVVLPFGASSK